KRISVYVLTITYLALSSSVLAHEHRAKDDDRESSFSKPRIFTQNIFEGGIGPSHVQIEKLAYLSDFSVFNEIFYLVELAKYDFGQKLFTELNIRIIHYPEDRFFSGFAPENHFRSDFSYSGNLTAYHYLPKLEIYVPKDDWNPQKLRNLLAISMGRLVFAHLLDGLNWKTTSSIDSFGVSDLDLSILGMQISPDSSLQGYLNSLYGKSRQFENAKKFEIIRSTAYFFSMLAYRSIASPEVVRDLDYEASLKPYFRIYNQFIALEERGEFLSQYLAFIMGTIFKHLEIVLKQVDYSDFGLTENEQQRILHMASQSDHLLQELELNRLKRKSDEVISRYMRDKSMATFVRSIETELNEDNPGPKKPSPKVKDCFLLLK
ncbi:MAG: hypothetical protein KDD35_08850, partial [Bdellovibrionales bacterium]|nr:hypothetical protein [Bdellovibrionales bacterium]